MLFLKNEKFSIFGRIKVVSFSNYRRKKGLTQVMQNFEKWNLIII